MKHDQAENLRLQLKGILPKNARTISIVSGKGGVGKSNIALNFALELTHHDYRVLLIDLDVGMGNIDILLGEHADKSMRDMLEKRLAIRDIIIEGPDNLAYVSGGTGFTAFFSMDQSKTDHFLLEFQKLRSMYDYIIFDMGAGISSDSLSFILASDESIIVTTPEPTSITDAYAMVKKIIYHEKDMPIDIIMNRVREKRQGKLMMDRFQNIIQTFLHIESNALGILPDDPIVTEAVSRQTPFLLWKEKAPVSKALQRLTINYLTNKYEVVNKEQTLSFVQKLKRLLVEK